MTEYIFLNKLPLGTDAKIILLEGDAETLQRLNDLGAIPGTKIKSLMKSPLGDPTAYLIRGAVIALRSEDSSKISVLANGGNYENKK